MAAGKHRRASEHQEYLDYLHEQTGKVWDHDDLFRQRFEAWGLLKAMGPVTPSLDELIERAGEGEVQSSPRLPSALTDTEREILDYITKQGRPVYAKQIAVEVGITDGHVRRLLGRESTLRVYYGVENRRGAGYYVTNTASGS